MGVQVTFGDVEQGTGGHPQGAAFDQELVLTLQHVEALVRPVLYVRRRSTLRLSHHLKERVRPAGLLTGDLAGHQLAQHPQQAAFSGPYLGGATILPFHGGLLSSGLPCPCPEVCRSGGRWARHTTRTVSLRPKCASSVRLGRAHREPGYLPTPCAVVLGY